MWRGMAPHEGTHVGAEEGTGEWRVMESSREPFMAPSGQGPGGNIEDRRVTGGKSILGILLLQGKCCDKVVQRSMDRAGEQGMSRRSPVSMDDSRDGCHCSRCGGCSDGGSSKEHEFSVPLMEEVDDQGETWLKSENSSAERR